MVDLFPHGLAAVALAVLGCVLGASLVPYAARRTLAQPVGIAVQDEVHLLLGVLSDLRRLPYLTSLTPTDFAAGANGRIWEALLLAGNDELSQMRTDPAEAECEEAGVALAARAEEVHTAVQAILASGPRGRIDLDRLAHLSGLSASTVLSDDEVLDAAQAVLMTGSDRKRLSGAALVAPTSDPDSIDPDRPPLHRVPTTPTRLRRVLSAALLGGVGSLLYTMAATTGLTGVGLWLAVAALGALSAGSLVIALVDLDTLYVDLRAFLLTSVVAWGLAVAALGSAGRWSDLVAGVVMVVATAVFFEVVNRVHRLVRGVDGQGFGDTLIIIATVGIPPALMGDWILGYYSIMGGVVAALLGWIASWARGKVTRATPVAFGPYLAAGWALGWVAYMFVGA